MDPDRRILSRSPWRTPHRPTRFPCAHGRGRGEPRKFIQRNAKDVRFLTTSVGIPRAQTPDIDRVEPVELQARSQKSHLDYAMSVIVGRALPDVRDGSNRCTAGSSRHVRRRLPARPWLLQSARAVVGDVLGSYHPHGDSAVYDALVRMVQPWSGAALPAVDGQGNFGSPATTRRGLPVHRGPHGAAGHGDGARHRRGDRRLQTQLRRPRAGAGDPAQPVPEPAGQRLVGHRGGDGHQYPAAQPAEVNDGIQWALEHPDATKEELLEALIERVKGPDFPTGAYRGPIRVGQPTAPAAARSSCAVSWTSSRTTAGRTCLVVTELPYQVNPDTLTAKIAELADAGKVTGIADLRDDSSSRTGQRLVVVLKRDAQPRVVLSQLYKHTQLQETFRGEHARPGRRVPRTLSLDAFVTHWIDHQIEVIQRRTRLPAAQGRGTRPHPARIPERPSTPSTT